MIDPSKEESVTEPTAKMESEVEQASSSSPQQTTDARASDSDSDKDPSEESNKKFMDLYA